MRLAVNPKYRFWYPPAECRGCGTGLDGEDVHAQAANLVSGNFIPAGRAARPMADIAGARVSPGWIASVRAKAAALVEPSGFMDLAAGLLRQAEAVHADETPAHAAGACGTRTWPAPRS